LVDILNINLISPQSREERNPTFRFGFCPPV